MTAVHFLVSLTAFVVAWASLGEALPRGRPGVADVASSDASLAQVRATLLELRRSISDASRASRALASRSRQRCAGTAGAFRNEEAAANASLGRLRAELGERRAAAHEAEAAAEEAQADMVLVGRTVNQTEEALQGRGSSGSDMLAGAGGTGVSRSAAPRGGDEHLMRTLIRKKRQTLASLRGESEMLLPAAARLQAVVAETEHRVTDRAASAAGLRLLAAASSAGCASTAQRAERRAAAHTAEAASIETAVQALEHAAAAAPHSGPGMERLEAESPEEEDAQEVDGTPSGVSLLQLGEQAHAGTAPGGAEEDLLSIFGGRDEPALPENPVTAFAVEPGTGSEVDSSPVARVAGEDDGAVPTRPPPLPHAKGEEAALPASQPKIRQLLAQLKAKGMGSADQREWCSRERAQGRLDLRFAQASAVEMSTEAEGHTEAEAELNGELSRLQASATVVAAVSKGTSQEAAEEDALLKRFSKDGVLATKIIAQAIALLAEQQSASSSGIQAATAALKSAEATFEAQAQGAGASRQEATAEARLVVGAAEEVTHTLKRERMNVELSRDNHVSERERSSSEQRLHEARARGAAAYLQDLDRECKENIFALAERERKAQIRALKDAQRALEGKEPLATASPSGLRGGVAPALEAGDLSPMERAAAEMGVAVDDK